MIKFTSGRAMDLLALPLPVLAQHCPHFLALSLALELPAS